MSNQSDPKLPKWPFFLGNIILLTLACFIFAQSKSPLGQWQIFFFVSSGALGALLGVAPFLVEYWAAVKLVETSGLVSTVDQIRHLELLAVQIGAATAQWQLVQEYSASSVTAAKEIADKMGAEAAEFTGFLKKANDSEKTNLRLELDKLRRVENDWLQIIVRMLDHTYALYRAAERSGQPGLIEQMGHFQNSCRDVARRIGLVPFAPTANEPFDPARHRPADPQSDSSASGPVRDTIATGFTYQGRLIRPALVTLQGSAEDIAATMAMEGNGKKSDNVLAEQPLI